MFLGAGIGNGLESPVLLSVQNILAIDVNSEYLAILRRRFTQLPIRTTCCSFPFEFREDGQFDLAYGDLVFEYLDVDSSLRCIAKHLIPNGQLIALLQQPSHKGNVTFSGVSSLHPLREYMTVHPAEVFVEAATKNGYRLESLRAITRMSKPFAEVTLTLM